MRRLKGKKKIEILFEEGASINMFPFRVVFIKTDVSAIGVSVGKRNFKLAIHRNRIKRQMREAARLYFWPIIEKSTENYLVMLIYTGKEKPKFNQVVEKIKNTAYKFKQRTS